MPVSVLPFEQADPGIQDKIRRRAFREGKKPEGYQLVLDLDDKGEVSGATIEETPGEFMSGAVSALENVPAAVVGVGAGAAAGALAAPSVVGAPVAAIGAGTAASLGTSLAQRKFLDWAAPSLQRRLDIYRASNPKSAMLGAGVSSLAPQRMLLGGIGKEALSGGLKGALGRTLAKEGLDAGKLARLTGTSFGVGAGIDAALQIPQNYKDKPDQGVIADTWDAIKETSIPQALAQGGLEAAFGSGNIRPWLGKPMSKGFQKFTGKAGVFDAPEGTKPQEGVQEIPGSDMRDKYRIALSEVEAMGEKPTPEQIENFNQKWSPYAFTASPAGVKLMRDSLAQADSIAKQNEERIKTEEEKTKKKLAEEEQLKVTTDPNAVIGEAKTVVDTAKVMAGFFKEGGATHIPINSAGKEVLIGTDAGSLAKLRETNPALYKQLEDKVLPKVEELRVKKEQEAALEAQAKAAKELKKKQDADAAEAAKVEKQKAKVAADLAKAERYKKTAEDNLGKLQQLQGGGESSLPVGVGAYGQTLVGVPRETPMTPVVEETVTPPVTPPRSEEVAAPQTPIVPTETQVQAPIVPIETPVTPPTTAAEQTPVVPVEPTTPETLPDAEYTPKPPYDPVEGKRQFNEWKKGKRKNLSANLIEYVEGEVNARRLEMNEAAGELSKKQTTAEEFIPEDVAKENKMGAADLESVVGRAKNFALAMSDSPEGYLDLFKRSLGTLAKGVKGEAIKRQSLQASTVERADANAVIPGVELSYRQRLEKWYSENNVSEAETKSLEKALVRRGKRGEEVTDPETMAEVLGEELGKVRGEKKGLPEIREGESSLAGEETPKAPVQKASPGVMQQTVVPLDKLVAGQKVTVVIPASPGRRARTIEGVVTTGEEAGLSAKIKDKNGKIHLLPNNAVAKVEGTSSSELYSDPLSLMTIYHGLSNIPTLARDATKRLADGLEILLDWKLIRGGLQNLRKVDPKNAPTVIAGYRDYSQRLQQYNNDWNAPYLAAQGRYKFTKEEHRRVTKHIDYLSTQNGVSPVALTERETALYNAFVDSKMRSFLAKKDGPLINGLREARQDANWWWDAEMDGSVRQELQTVEGEKKWKKLYDNWYLQEMGTLKDVDETWNAILGKTVTKMETEGPTYASMRKAQGIGLPPEMRVKDVALRMFIHNIRAAADLGFHWAFERDPARARIMGISDDGRGVKYDIATPPEKLLVTNPVEAAKYFPPEDGASEPVDNIAHLEDVKNLRAHLNSARGMNLDWADRITGFVNGAIMGPLTVFRDAATTGGASLELLGVKDMPMLIRGAAKAFTDRGADMIRGGGIRSRRSGDFFGQEAEVRDWLTKVGDFGRKWQGRDAGEKGIRDMLWETSKLYSPGLIRRALADEKGAVAQMEYFVGNDWKKILQSSEGEQRLRDRFAKGFTEHFQGNYGPEYLPWALVRGTDKQFLKLMFNLSRWGIERANRFRELTIGNLKKTGNVKPLLGYALGTAAAGVGFDMLQEYVLNKKPREMTAPEYLKFAFNSAFSTKDKVDEFIYTALSKGSLMGFMGLYGQILENAYKLKEGEAGMLPNIPAVGMAKKLVERLSQYFEARDPNTEEFWYGLLDLGRVIAKDNIQGARVVENALSEEDVTAGREGRMFKRLEAQPFENVGDLFNIRSANPFTASGEFIRETDEKVASSLLPQVMLETKRRGLQSPPKAKFPMISKIEDDPGKVSRYYDFMSSVGRTNQLDNDIRLWELNRKKNATTSALHRLSGP